MYYSRVILTKESLGWFYMKKIMILFVILCASFSLFSKGNLYAVYVIDNEVAEIDCVESLFMWQDRMNKIHHYTGMKTKERLLAVGLSDSIEEWSRESVLAAVEDIAPDNQDTVFFFFAGQSEKLSESKSRYPKMLLQYGTSMELEEVAGILAEKRPGLLLVFADFYDQIGDEISKDVAVSRANRSVVYGNYRKLFNEKRHAAVIAASCSAGNKGEAGIFTSHFAASIDECTASGDVSWQDLLEKISEPVGKFRNKACWEIRPQKDFINNLNITIEKNSFPEWRNAWDENWYDDREWYDDGGWNGEIYDGDEEYYAEDEEIEGDIF